MSNDDIYFFKAIPTRWFAGEVQSLPYTEKGMFSDIMYYYWFKNCTLTIEMLKLRFSRDLELLESTLSKSVLLDIIILTENDDVKIKFLDEQYKTFNSISKIRSINGRKGGLKKASSKCYNLLEQKPSKSLANVKQKPSILELELETDKKEYKEKNVSVNVFRSFNHLAITVEDNKKLLDLGYNQNQINEVYDNIENYKKNKDYKNLYLTAKNWLSKIPKTREQIEAEKRYEELKAQLKYSDEEAVKANKEYAEWAKKLGHEPTAKDLGLVLDPEMQAYRLGITVEEYIKRNK